MGIPVVNLVASGTTVSVIVPVRDEAGTLEEFLDSLLAQRTRPAEIVVADAGSRDHSTRIIRDRIGSGIVKLVESGPSYPGRARNTAIRAATQPWIAMTDAGTIVNDAWLSELTAASMTNPDADVVFGTYVPLVRTFLEGCLALAFVAPSHEVDGRRFRGPSTASMLIRRRVWEELGGFPENLRACEDLLFFNRLSGRGYRTAYASGATVAWRLPSTWRGIFRRFRTYSCNTIQAGLGSRWQRSVCMMYLAAALCAVASVVVHWSFAFVPFAGLLARAVRSVRARRDIAAEVGAGLRVHLAVCAMLVWIDAAAFAGVFDYLRGARSVAEVPSV
jgi:cellulose synthase/poly-beta-1,6-N-acetylglucosamine synthase-like glycosyltransferase